MNNLKPQDNSIPFNVVGHLTANRSGYRTTSFSSDEVYCSSETVSINKTYLKQIITKYIELITKDGRLDREAVLKADIKICPKFVINMRKFFSSSSPHMDAIHRNMKSKLYHDNDSSLDLHIIYQLHYNPNVGEIYLSGFSLCHYGSIIHSYNMRILDIEK